MGNPQLDWYSVESQLSSRKHLLRRTRPTTEGIYIDNIIIIILANPPPTSKYLGLNKYSLRQEKCRKILISPNAHFSIKCDSFIPRLYIKFVRGEQFFYRIKCSLFHTAGIYPMLIVIPYGWNVKA